MPSPTHSNRSPHAFPSTTLLGTLTALPADVSRAQVDMYFVNKYNTRNPTTPIAGLVPSLWVYAGAPGSQMDAQGRMSQWTDQTGNMNHFTMTVESRQPTYVALGINGLPSLQMFAAQLQVRAANSNIDIHTSAPSNPQTMSMPTNLAAPAWSLYYVARMTALGTQVR